MVVAELLGIAAVSGSTAWWSMRQALRGRLEVGLAAIGLTAIAAFALGLLLARPLTSFAVSTFAILAGFAAAIAGGGEERRDASDGDPPWWPSFERDLRDYERGRPARPRSRARG